MQKIHKPKMQGQVGREEVQMVATKNKSDASLPVISVEAITPEEKKGLMFRSYRLDIDFKKQSLNELHYIMYLKHTWLRAMIDKKAKMGTTIGFYIRKNEGAKENLERKQAIENFFNYPNPQETWTQTLFKTLIQVQIFAESFWEMVLDKNDIPKDFYILDGVVYPQFDEHGMFKDPAFIQKMRGDSAEFKINEVIWFKFPDPMGNITPPSLVETLEAAVLLDIYAMGLNKKIFTQGIKKGKVFAFPENTGEEQMKRNRIEIKNLHSSVEGAYSAFIAVEGECEIKDLALVETKMEAKDLREFLRDEFAAVSGTPVQKLGLANVTLEDVEYVERTFYSQEVQPLLNLVEEQINLYLVKTGINDYTFKFKQYSIRDHRETARLLDVLRRRGYTTINEGRELIGFEPLEGENYNKPFLEFPDGNIVFIDQIDEYMKMRTEAMTNKGLKPEQIKMEAEENDPFSMIGKLLAKMKPEEIVEALNKHYTKLNKSGNDSNFSFVESLELSNSKNTIAQQLNKDLDNMKNKIIRLLKKEISNSTLTLASSSKDTIKALEILESITGKELSISIIDGKKKSYLQGYKNFATKLGFKNGDEGKNGKFIFDFVNPDTFNKFKKSAEEISKKSIDGFVNGTTPKFSENNLKNVLLDGLVRGKSNEMISQDINDFFENIKSYKVAEIIDTELPNAFNLGRIDAAKTSGISKARIELGNNPCDWCVENSENVTTLEEAEEYMAEHHPNNDCMVIPIEDDEEAED